MQDPLALRHTPGIHQIHPSLSIEWLDEGKIHVITLLDVKRESVEAYRDLNIAIMRSWAVDEVYLTLQNLTAPGVIVTPAVRSTGQEIWDTNTGLGLHGMIVLVTQRGSLLGSTIRNAFVNTLMRMRPNTKCPVFFETDREKALARLRQVLGSHEAQPTN